MHWELLLDGPLPSKPPFLYVLNFNAHRKHLALAWTMSLDFELAIFHNCTFTQLDSFIHSFFLNFLTFIYLFFWLLFCWAKSGCWFMCSIFCERICLMWIIHTPLSLLEMILKLLQLPLPWLKPFQVSKVQKLDLWKTPGLLSFLVPNWFYSTSSMLVAGFLCTGNLASEEDWYHYISVWQHPKHKVLKTKRIRA